MSVGSRWEQDENETRPGCPEEKLAEIAFMQIRDAPKPPIFT